MNNSKVVVITGTSSGIGFEVAKFLSMKNYIVYGISRSKVHDKCVKSIQADVTDYEQLKQAYQDIFDVEGHIDCLINNAGMGISGSIEQTSLEDAKYMMDVNFMGVFHSTKAMLPFLRQSNKSKIINISSVAGRLAIPFQGFYSSSKAAINAFSESLRIELSPLHIQVCSVMPGDIKTGFTKNRRKNENESELYQKRVDKSIQVMEKDEHNGMDAEYAAKVIYKLVKRKRMPIYKTIGVKYKVFIFLQKLLPARLVNNLVGSIYGFKKG
ncbi:SDR family oxidoreductase [Mariniplasma anaerobium]|uniref:Short-chain dehydrogenase n=1 Tax=Mariniplasma anaerobium TaxID=2735436 RepID=A0A7U9XVY3_9MOLU|nr:SDR family oxidoreductase [Mariniplasma anaerobium]BCR35413.1 short-chain dehydrogenase [Mariniplasma anaerobium]